MIGRLLHNIFRRDIGRKLVALILASLVWWLLNLYVSGDVTLPLEVRAVNSRATAEAQRFTAPAVFVVVPEGVRVRNLGTKEIRVQVKGLRAEVEGMQLHAILEVPADALGTAAEVEHAIVLRPGQFRTERGRPNVSEIDFEPREVRLLLAQEIKRSFELSPRNVTITGSPRAGYSVDTYACRIRPSQVELVGPRALVELILQDPGLLRLQPIEIDGQSLSVTRQVGLDRERVDPSIAMLTISGLVEVTVPIMPQDRARQLLGVPVDYENDDLLLTRNLRLVESTEAVDVIVSGPPQVLDSLTDKDLRRALRLVYDWNDAGLEQARDRVTVYLSGLLGVEVTDLEGRPPVISYQLERTDGPIPATLPAREGGESP